MSENNNLKSLANFIYEIGILSRTPRSGLWFLGSGKQSVAEHILRTTLTAYTLAHLITGARANSEGNSDQIIGGADTARKKPALIPRGSCRGVGFIPKVDVSRVIFLCLAHDLGEGRTSDLNYVHQKYGQLAEARAIEDIARSLPFGAEISRAFKEFEENKTFEAKVAKDADQLEWMATLREQTLKGNTKAGVWAKIAFKRLETPAAKKLGKMILKTNPDSWWFDETDKWFVGRHPKLRRWKK